MTVATVVQEKRDLASWEREEEEDGIVRVESVQAVAQLNRSEIESQLDAAHKYPRTPSKFMRKAIAMATENREIAEMCIYALPRGGKTISGPSVRLAEIMASAYGNLHVGARVFDADDSQITAQGVAWDLEQNVKVSVEVKRRITKKNGTRFDDDMITVAGNAAASIALRNAIFRVIPRTYVNGVYDKARDVAVGDAKTLVDRRTDLLARLAKMGATQDRVLNALGKVNVEDITLEDMEKLIGMGTAIKNGDRTVDDCFPAPVAQTPVAHGEEGKRVSLKPPKAETPAKPKEPDADAIAAAELARRKQQEREPGQE
jgi:hypothetical protein